MTTFTGMIASVSRWVLAAALVLTTGAALAVDDYVYPPGAEPPPYDESWPWPEPSHIYDMIAISRAASPNIRRMAAHKESVPEPGRTRPRDLHGYLKKFYGGNRAESGLYPPSIGGKTTI